LFASSLEGRFGFEQVRVGSAKTGIHCCLELAVVGRMVYMCSFKWKRFEGYDCETSWKVYIVISLTCHVFLSLKSHARWGALSSRRLFLQWQESNRRHASMYLRQIIQSACGPLSHSGENKCLWCRWMKVKQNIKSFDTKIKEVWKVTVPKRDFNRDSFFY